MKNVVRRMITVGVLVVVSMSNLFGVGVALVGATGAMNLIANPNVEMASGQDPDAWYRGGWGTNSVSLTYKTDGGRDDDASLLVTIDSIVDGDAKWYHAAANVTEGKTYRYGDWYKSDVGTSIIAEFQNQAGQYYYEYLTYVAPSVNAWKLVETDFVIPAGYVKVTLFHVIDQVGWLQTDSFALMEQGVPEVPEIPEIPEIPEVPETPGVPEVPETQNNLVNNGDFEIANGNKPLGWGSAGWGAYVATLSYDGHSATAKVTALTEGDVKWAFDAVPVVAGETYIYGDQYKSNVSSRVVVEFRGSGSSYTYLELASAGVAVDWANYEASFVVPTGVTKVTVYHLLDRVGSLTIDDVSLMQVVDVPQIPNNPNPDPELVDNYLVNGLLDNNFGGWYNGSWGDNSRNLTQVTNDGHTGNRSLKVAVSNYRDGDAKWMTGDVNLLPGRTYLFSVWYKTDVEPSVGIRYIMSDGSERYGGLPKIRPPIDATTTWTQYRDTFVVPEGAVSTTLYVSMNTNGWLMADDYVISDYVPTAFDRSLLTIMFDDGFVQNISTAMPMLDAYGFKSSHCYMTARLDGQIAVNGMLALDRGGHEICGHTITHPDLTTLSPSQLHEELATSQTILEGYLGKSVDIFVSPYGAYNSATVNKIMSLYRSHRGVDEGYNTKDNFDITNTRVRNVFVHTTAAEIASWVQEAQNGGYWLILLYHEIGVNPGLYGTEPEMFAQHLSVIDESGIEVKTYSGALNEVLGQY